MVGGGRPKRWAAAHEHRPLSTRGRSRDSSGWIRTTDLTILTAVDEEFGLQSEVMQVLGYVPFRDPGAVAPDLEALHREERLDDLRAERPA
jgi:hypothetical protein